MMTADVHDYDDLPNAVKDLAERVWTSRMAEAQLDAYWEGFEDGREQGIRDERTRRAADLCERCGSDVSACFNCMAKVITGALPEAPPDSTK